MSIAKFNAVLDIQADEGVIEEPITLDEAKHWMRVDIDDDDDLIELLITAARRQCENAICISFVPKTITAVLRNDCGNIFLPYCPLVHGSNDSDVILYDADGVEIEDAEIEGVDFPYIKSPLDSYLKAVYSAGYSELPEDLKTALKAQVAYLYENRGDANYKSSISPIAKTILSQYDRRVS